MRLETCAEVIGKRDNPTASKWRRSIERRHGGVSWSARQCVFQQAQRIFGRFFAANDNRFTRSPKDRPCVVRAVIATRDQGGERFMCGPTQQQIGRSKRRALKRGFSCRHEGVNGSRRLCGDKALLSAKFLSTPIKRVMARELYTRRFTAAPTRRTRTHSGKSTQWPARRTRSRQRTA